uniref:Uncharacterized protein n=1 Tax=Glossina austeni TaxID=7395 RepID=A0A1A9UUP1_GLOAU
MRTKYKTFVTEPIGDKPVTALAGIGRVLGKRLKRRFLYPPWTILSPEKGPGCVYKMDEKTVPCEL